MLGLAKVVPPAGSGAGAKKPPPAAATTAAAAAVGGGPVSQAAGAKSAAAAAAAHNTTVSGSIWLSPAVDVVDFRAACICHSKVVDTAFVCSICLSIFCEVPEGARCLICHTELSLGRYGKRPVVKA